MIYVRHTGGSRDADSDPVVNDMDRWVRSWEARVAVMAWNEENA